MGAIILKGPFALIGVLLLLAFSYPACSAVPVPLDMTSIFDQDGIWSVATGDQAGDGFEAGGLCLIENGCGGWPGLPPDGKVLDFQLGNYDGLNMLMLSDGEGEVVFDLAATGQAAKFDNLRFLTGTGNGASGTSTDNLKARLVYQDSSTQELILLSQDWYLGSPPRTPPAPLTIGISGMARSSNELSNNFGLFVFEFDAVDPTKVLTQIIFMESAPETTITGGIRYNILAITGYSPATWSVVEDFNDALSSEWVFFGSATHDLADGRIALTADAGDQAGAVFHNRALTTTSFTAEFDVYCGGSDGGDGLVLAFVKAPGLGVGGGQMGFLTGLDGYGVEFDTYNGHDAVRGPESENHVGVSRAAPVGSNAECLEIWNLPYDLENDTWFHVEIVFESGHIQTWMSNATVGWARTQVIDYTIQGWADYDAYFGFTAATGALFNLHAIDNFSLETQVSPSDRKLSISAPGGAVTLSWTPFGTESYTIEWSDDLKAWTPEIGMPITETTWAVGWIETFPRWRFWRVSAPNQ